VLLLDNSAWSRVVAGGLPTERAETVAGWLDQRQLAICLPFLLEAGYSARASAEYREMMDEFDLLPGSPQPEPCDCSLIRGSEPIKPLP
jgi:hypothetical protein